MMIKTSKFSFLRAAFVLVPFFLTACTDPPKTVQPGKLDQQFYELVKAKDFDQAAMLFSNEKSPGEWAAYMKENNALLGDLRSYEVKDRVVNTILTGQVYITRYKTKYANGEANEVVTIKDEINNGGIQIVMYKVTPTQKTLKDLSQQQGAAPNQEAAPAPAAQ
ncbi:MAG: hypothetical protein IDH49_06775 [Gammaproteobacteria bacterium]|nr:hypothetical protein [Gammaproteobacteria bacterium]